MAQAPGPRKEKIQSDLLAYFPVMEKELLENPFGPFPKPLTKINMLIWSEIDPKTRSVYVRDTSHIYTPTDGDKQIWSFREDGIDGVIVKCYNMERMLWDKDLLERDRINALVDGIELLYLCASDGDKQTAAREASPLFNAMYTILEDIQPPKNGKWYSFEEYDSFEFEYKHKFKIFNLCGRTKKTT